MQEEDFLNNMRGWVVTAAALFVGMAFQAAMQPPVWMPKTEIWSLSLSWAHPRYKNLSPEEKRLAGAAAVYQLLNAVIFSMALTLMTILVMMGRDKAAKALSYVKRIIPIISVLVAVTFVRGITDDKIALAVILVYMVLYASMTLFGFYVKETQMLVKRCLLHRDEVSRHDHQQDHRSNTTGSASAAAGEHPATSP